MVEVSEYIKWGLVASFSVFGLYILYQFARSQGWITVKQTRLARVRAARAG